MVGFDGDLSYVAFLNVILMVILKKMFSIRHLYRALSSIFTNIGI